jgi:hypothetical protein
MKNSWWRRFVARHIVADDPRPGLSRLDRLNGLKPHDPMEAFEADLQRQADEDEDDDE